MNEELVTLIIPVYNIEKYITRCLESVVSQTYSNLQIILVNDGSIDNSSEICQEFAQKDERIVLINKQNEGVSKARNKAIQYIKGKFVMFIDGDDWIDQNCVEICERKMHENQLDLLMFPYIREYKNKSIVRKLYARGTVFLEEARDKVLRSLIGPRQEELNDPTNMERLNAVWGKMYRADYLKQLEFEEISEIGAEDLWFNILYANNVKKAQYIEDTYYHYNKVNISSITKKDNADVTTRWFNLYRRIESFIENECTDTEEDYKTCLNNRIIINLLGINLRVMNTSNSIWKKRKTLKEILNKEEYKEAFRKFSFKNLGLKWKAYYLSCKYKRIFLVMFILYIANRLKSRG